MAGLSSDFPRDSAKKDAWAADSDTKEDDEQIELATSSRHDGRPTVLQKAKRHCAKWWWLHLAIFCAVFLFVALMLVYVGMPRIAQHDVDRTSLELTAMSFMDPTDENVLLTQNAVLHNPSTFTPTLDPFPAKLTTLQLNGSDGEVFTELPLPEIHAKRGNNNITVHGTVPFLNTEYLTQYVSALLVQETVTSRLDGRTNLHLGALPVVKVNYNSLVTYKGMNGLKGFNVTGARINITKPAGEPNFSGFAFVPNPSVITVAMGNVTLNLATESAGIIGLATVNDMTVVPGNNSFPMTAVINQTSILSSLKDGFVELLITGNSSTYNGVSLPYYEKALASNILRLNMNVMQVIADSSH